MALTKCSVIACSGEVVARGLCDLHYRRLLHHGTTDNTRPKYWGKRESHPLYESWRWMIRTRVAMCEQWRKDFWSFVKDVGDRPSEKHRCYRLDESKPYGPKNFFWREVAFGKEASESEKEYRSRYMREWRKVNNEAARNIDLKKHYGITLEQYNAMLEAQGGVCAICGGVNDMKDHRTGKLRNLSVDHCHAEGHVRKLLCQYCNQGLGNFKDSVALLRKAALYLEGRLGSDGVVLTCISHPNTGPRPTRKQRNILGANSLETVEIELPKEYVEAMKMAKKAKKGKTPMKGSGKQGC